MSLRTSQEWLPGSVAIYRVPKAAQFISADDFLALAVKSYLAAVRSLIPPDKQPWSEDGDSWANAEDFYRGLLWEVEERLRRAALASGDLREVPWVEDDDEQGAGRSPADMGHGCPAFAPAVGPAPSPCPTGEAARGGGNQGLHNLAEAPLFCARTMQELPAGSAAATVTQQGGIG